LNPRLFYHGDNSDIDDGGNNGEELKKFASDGKDETDDRTFSADKYSSVLEERTKDGDDTGRGEDTWL
jgi:hypothetical protein